MVSGKTGSQRKLTGVVKGYCSWGKRTSATNSAVLVKVDCEGIFDGTIGAAGADTVTERLNPAKEKILQLGELALSCTVT